MSTTPVSSVPGTTPTPPAAAPIAETATNNQSLSQADFLKIMVAQFTTQDPLSSGSDGGSGSGTSDYVNELMSMTNLTTMQTMSSQEAISLAGTLPGSTVQLNVNGASVTGPVTNAQINTGTLYVTVNGQQYPASDVVAITQSQAQAQAAAAAASAAAAAGSTSN